MVVPLTITLEASKVVYHLDERQHQKFQRLLRPTFGNELESDEDDNLEEDEDNPEDNDESEE